MGRSSKVGPEAPSLDDGDDCLMALPFEMPLAETASGTIASRWGGMGQPHNMADYDKIRRTFQYDIPEVYNFAGDVIDVWAEDPGRLALWWVDDTGRETKKTFRELSAA